MIGRSYDYDSSDLNKQLSQHAKVVLKMVELLHLEPCTFNYCARVYFILSQSESQEQLIQGWGELINMTVYV